MLEIREKKNKGVFWGLFPQHSWLIIGAQKILTARHGGRKGRDKMKQMWVPALKEVVLILADQFGNKFSQLVIKHLWSTYHVPALFRS